MILKLVLSRVGNSLRVCEFGPNNSVNKRGYKK